MVAEVLESEKSNDSPFLHRRRSLRLKHYDYSQPGGYFITICSHNWKCIFGEIGDGSMRVNEFGMIVREEWLRSPKVRTEVILDAFIVMPNHFHGIIIINEVEGERNDIRTDGRGAQPCARTMGGKGTQPKDGDRDSQSVRARSQSPTEANNVRTPPNCDVHIGAHSRAPLRRTPKSLGSFVAGFKSIVTKRVNEIRGSWGQPVWQRNYYEHVIRDDEHLYTIRDYVLNNPARWSDDEFY
jgi:REP element-mobilizing transposase RayT